MAEDEKAPKKAKFDRFMLASLLHNERKSYSFNPAHLGMDLFHRHQKSNPNSVHFDPTFINHPMPSLDSSSSNAHSLLVSSTDFVSLPSLPAARNYVTLPMIPDLPRSGMTLEDLFRFVGVEDDSKNWQPNIPAPPHAFSQFRFCCSSFKPSNPKNLGFPCSQRTRNFRFQ